MSDTALLLQDVAKHYRIYSNPLERLKELFFPNRSRAQIVQALNGVNLTISRGHTVGIVGRNGSGKSTLLQIIAGTLTPSTGNVTVNGRVSALLELGSGFNMEFTGRENVFFQGRLMGLSTSQINAKFDEITYFADIGDFVDRPVKTYSSGMHVRLAFAVAISNDPDILIVDEALSVGDEAFQRKCFSRLKQIQERGATVLFVTHSASLVVELCDSAVLLDRGEIIAAGNPKAIVGAYHRVLFAPADKYESVRDDVKKSRHTPVLEQPAAHSDGRAQDTKAELAVKSPGNPAEGESQEFFDPELVPKSTVEYTSQGARILDPHIRTLDGQRVNVLVKGREYIYSYRIKFSEPGVKIRLGMMIKTVTGYELGGKTTHAAGNGIDVIPTDSEICAEFKFSCLLYPGVYFLNAGLVGMKDGTEVYLHRMLDAAMFRVQPEPNSLVAANVDFMIECRVIDMNSTKPRELAVS